MPTKKTAQKAPQSTNAKRAAESTPPLEELEGELLPPEPLDPDEQSTEIAALYTEENDFDRAGKYTLVKAAPSTALDIQRPTIAREPLFDMWLKGRKPRTIEAYRDDLRHFSRWLTATGVQHGAGVDGDAGRAVDFLVSLSHGEANELVLSYRGAQIEHGDAPASVSRRLSAIRSLVKVANITGRITWLIGVEGVKHEKYKDTRGPELDVIHLIFETANGKGVDPYTAARDTAILSLLFHRGLRRAEVAELCVEHVDLKRNTLSILGKGRNNRETLSLQEPLLKNLKVWLAVRGQKLQDNTSLFNITGKGIWYVLRQLAKKANVKVPVRPHGMRHAAVTAALDVTNGNVREVAKFSRHKNIQTVTIYDDARRDMSGDVASKMAKATEKKTPTHSLEELQTLADQYMRAGDDAFEQMIELVRAGTFDWCSPTQLRELFISSGNDKRHPGDPSEFQREILSKALRVTVESVPSIPQEQIPNVRRSGNESAEHVRLKFHGSLWLRKKGALDVKMEASVDGFRVDVCSPTMELFVECGDTEFQKIVELTENGKVLLLPYSSNGDVGVLFERIRPRASVFDNNSSKGLWK